MTEVQADSVEGVENDLVISSLVISVLFLLYFKSFYSVQRRCPVL